MIAIDDKGTLISVTVLGEFTLADYKEFENLVNYKVRFEGPVNLCFDLREMLSFTVDVAWEEIQFSRAHANSFHRIAIITESQWVAWSAWLSQVFVSADLEVFSTPAKALKWLQR